MLCWWSTVFFINVIFNYECSLCLFENAVFNYKHNYLKFWEVMCRLVLVKWYAVVDSICKHPMVTQISLMPRGALGVWIGEIWNLLSTGRWRQWCVTRWHLSPPGRRRWRYMNSRSGGLRINRVRGNTSLWNLCLNMPSLSVIMHISKLDKCHTITTSNSTNNPTSKKIK